MGFKRCYLGLKCDFLLALLHFLNSHMLRGIFEVLVIQIISFFSEVLYISSYNMSREVWLLGGIILKERCASLIIMMCLVLLIPGAQASSMGDMDVYRATEDCGKWIVRFNWSEMDVYKTSVSHGDSESGGIKISTDTLIMTSSADKQRVVKVAVMQYSSRDPSLVNASHLMRLVNETLSRSSVCGGSKITMRSMDGKPGAFASGIKCSNGEPVFTAAYPVDYHFDRPGGVLASDAVGVILSTYGQDATERLIDSVKIEQAR